MSWMEKLEMVQNVVDFMCENDVAPALQSQIISWTRFYHEHSHTNLRKKEMLRKLPLNLQRELFR